MRTAKQSDLMMAVRWGSCSSGVVVPYCPVFSLSEELGISPYQAVHQQV